MEQLLEAGNRGLTYPIRGAGNEQATGENVVQAINGMLERSDARGIPRYHEAYIAMQVWEVDR